MHMFIHTLDTIPKNWYMEMEMHREKKNSEELTQRLTVKFTFELESPLVYESLLVIRTNIFLEEGPMDVVPMCSAH